MSQKPKFKKLAANDDKKNSYMMNVLHHLFGDKNQVDQEGFKFPEIDENELKKLIANILAGTFNPSERYSPAAFSQALEVDKNRGYKGTPHSEGAFEMTDKSILDQVKQFKQNPPQNTKDLLTKQPVKLDNINVPSSSDRYKSMKEKLYGKSAENSNEKFVKTSQVASSSELKSILPKWDITDVLKSMASVANKNNLSEAEKQQSMVNIISTYEKSIAPLSQFLDRNDIKYK